MTSDQLKDRCRVDEITGCWMWAGALSEGKYPRVWQAESGKMKAMPGRRAAWLATGKTIPNGWRVYGTCDSLQCVNPAHVACGPVAEFGAQTRAKGSQRGNVRRIAANRATGRKRATLTPEQIAEIQGSAKTGQALAAEYGVSQQTISKARRGMATCHQAIGGMFSGLMAANDSRRRA